MISDLLINLYYYGFTLVLFLADFALNFTSGFTTLNLTSEISEGIGYMFGNIFAFNNILPISETLQLASIALTFKAYVLAARSLMLSFNFFHTIRKTFFM